MLKFDNFEKISDVHEVISFVQKEGNFSENLNRREQMKNSLFKTFYQLTLTTENSKKADALKYYLIEHQKNVAKLSVQLYEEFMKEKGFTYNKARTRTLHDAASLHDVGKLALIDLVDLQLKFSDEHLEKFKLHTSFGKKILDSLGFSKKFGLIAKYHHENWSGTGYYGLKQEKIPFMARIIKITDTFEAMSNRIRCYRQQLSRDEINKEMLLSFQKGDFDPQFQSAFFKNFSDFYSLIRENSQFHV